VDQEVGYIRFFLFFVKSFCYIHSCINTIVKTMQMCLIINKAQSFSSELLYMCKYLIDLYYVYVVEFEL
jgi:hypothetical protein